MDSSDDYKKLPDLNIAEVRTKKTKKSLAEFRSEQQDSDHRETDSDIDSDLSDSEYSCSVCSKKFTGFTPYKQHQKSGKHAKALLKKWREKKLLAQISGDAKVSENDEECLSFVKKPFGVCIPCGKQFGGPESYHMHLVSKAHKQKVLQSSILDQVRDNGEINIDMLKKLYKNKTSTDENTDDLLEDTKHKFASLKLKDKDVDDDEDIAGPQVLECKDCEKSFSGIIPYTQHIMSKVHAKTIEKKNLLEKIAPKDLQFSTKSDVRDISTLAVEDGILVCKLCSMAFPGPESAIMHLKSRGHSKQLEKLSRKQERKHERKQERKQKEATVAKHKLSSPSSNSDGDNPRGESSEVNEKVDPIWTYSPYYVYMKNASSHSKDKSDISPHTSSNREDPPKESYGSCSDESVNVKGEGKESKSTSSLASKEELETKNVHELPCNKDEITKDIAEENASVGNETFSSAHENYKKYKEIMNSLRKPDNDS